MQGGTRAWASSPPVRLGDLSSALSQRCLVAMGLGHHAVTIHWDGKRSGVKSLGFYGNAGTAPPHVVRRGP